MGLPTGTKRCSSFERLGFQSVIPPTIPLLSLSRSVKEKLDPQAAPNASEPSGPVVFAASPTVISPPFCGNIPIQVRLFGQSLRSTRWIKRAVKLFFLPQCGHLWTLFAIPRPHRIHGLKYVNMRQWGEKALERIPGE